MIGSVAVFVAESAATSLSLASAIIFMDLCCSRQRRPCRWELRGFKGAECGRLDGWERGGGLRLDGASRELQDTAAHPADLSVVVRNPQL